MADSSVVPTSPNKAGGIISRIGRKIGAAITAVLAGVWALIQYFIPDPMVYLHGLWDPKFQSVFMAAAILGLSIISVVWAYQKHRVLFVITGVFVYLLSSYSFFQLGGAYYNPSFGEETTITKGIMGSVYHKGIEFVFQECDRKADTVACRIKVQNVRAQQEAKVSDWKIVMEDGAVYTDAQAYRGKQEMGRRIDLDLPRGANAHIEIVFFGIPSSYENILKLGFEVDRKELSYKNLTIER